MIIDAHHHFWNYNQEEYEWIDESMSRIRRDFLPTDLNTELKQAAVDGVVTVQARQCLEETEWLLSLAEQHSFLYGVVGWVPLQDAKLGQILERYAAHAAFKGVRHVVQAEAPGFLDGRAFNRGIRELSRWGLSYDLLIVESQLEESIAFVDRHPDQPMVLDHAAKPRIREGKLEPWATRLRELAKREQVSCKLSGLVTEADPRNWSESQLWPYLETLLEAFGAERLMLGTDWPVCLVGCEYLDWVSLLRRLISTLSEHEQAAVLGENACRIYRLSPQGAS